MRSDTPDGRKRVYTVGDPCSVPMQRLSCFFNDMESLGFKASF